MADTKFIILPSLLANRYWGAFYFEVRTISARWILHILTDDLKRGTSTNRHEIAEIFLILNYRQFAITLTGC